MMLVRGELFTRTCGQALRGCRTYSSSAAAVPLSEALEGISKPRLAARDPQEVQVTDLSNGIRVASLENYSPISDVAVYINGGARYESPSDVGITHVLRNAAFLTNKNRTGFRMTREIEQEGGAVSATSTREHLIYSASLTRGRIGTALENIAYQLLEPLYQPWELSEAYNLTRIDKAHLQVTPQASMMDQIHKAAFRNGLGNSMYCPEDKIGKISSEQLQNYAARYFVGSNITVVGLGVDHKVLVDQLNLLLNGLPSGSKAPKPKQDYHGGDIRQRTGDPFVHAAVVAQGGSLGSKEALALGVLQQALGGAPYVKYGSNTASSRLNRAAHAVCQGPLMVSSLNVSYSDNGLFGFYAVAEPKNITEVMRSGVAEISQIAKSGLSNDEFNRARNQLKASILMASESRESIIEDIANQVSLGSNASYVKPADAVTAVDKVSKEEVIGMAKRILNGKASMAVTGDTASAPFLDQLF